MRVVKLEGEAWWEEHNLTKFDSRPGVASTFPRAHTAGVYLIEGFLGGMCVLLYDGRSTFLYGRLVTHSSEAYKPEGEHATTTRHT